MAKNTRPRTTTVAARIVAAAGAAAAAALLRREIPRTRAVFPALELTPGHRAGTGSPLLLLHGIGGIWRAWSPVLPYLEPHHDVIVPTLPGHAGGSPLDPTIAPSVEALADAVEGELDRMGLRQVHIAGNSLGGWIGIELARRGRARSLVLFSPPGAWRSQRSIELRAAGVRHSISTLGRYSSRADAMAANSLVRWLLLAAQVAHPNRVAPETLAAYIRANGAAPVVAPLLRAIPLRQVPPLPEVRDYPVRLVWGDRDRVLPFDGFGAPMLERLTGAELIRLKGAGHVPMSDEPDTVAKLILEVARSADNVGNAVVSTEAGQRNG
jgi:pimeloyl-ACP methyl ester carboxylesterase